MAHSLLKVVVYCCVVCVVVGPQYVSAQPTTNGVHLWLDVSAGAPVGSAGASVAVKAGRHVVQLRALHVGSSLIYPALQPKPGVPLMPLPVTAMTEVGVLYGRMKRFGLLGISAMAGVGIASANENQDRNDVIPLLAPSIPVETGLFFTPAPGLGFGMKVLGGINRFTVQEEVSNASLQFSILLGKIPKR